MRTVLIATALAGGPCGVWLPRSRRQGRRRRSSRRHLLHRRIRGRRQCAPGCRCSHRSRQNGRSRRHKGCSAKLEGLRDWRRRRTEDRNLEQRSYVRGVSGASGWGDLYSAARRRDGCGEDPQQVEEDIARRLVDGQLIRDPHVSVGLTAVHSKKYYIQGEVNKPGSYDLWSRPRLWRGW